MQELKRRGLIFMGIAFLLALITAMLFFNYLNNLERQIGPKVKIVVAAKDISPRTYISEDMLKEEEIPAKFARDSYVRSKEEVVGQISLIAINKDDIIQKNQLDVGIELPKGKRIVALAVNQVTGVGGLLTPGDRVDVIVSYAANEGGTRVERTILLLENVEIFTMGEAPPGLELGPLALPVEGLLPEEHFGGRMGVVTLLLDPKDAMRLIFMSNFGKEVRLILRHPDDQAEVKPTMTSITFEDFVRFK